MPAHNEAALLDPSVREVVAGARRRSLDFELLVVENGSQDDTAVIAARLADDDPEVLVRTLPRADYGLALRTGLLAAHGDVVVNFDANAIARILPLLCVEAIASPILFPVRRLGPAGTAY